MSGPVGGEPTGLEPTELAGVAEAETESAHAWALVDHDTEPVRRRFTPNGITAAAVTASLVVVVAVAILGGYAIASRRQNAPVAAQPSSEITAPLPQAPPLAGTYRLTYDPTGRTSNGTALPGLPDPQTSYWAFRSTCSNDGCIATGIGLDKDNHELARTPQDTATLRFVDGRWQEARRTGQTDQQMCLRQNDSVGPGQQTEKYGWSLEPQTENTLGGALITTVVTNECGYSGVVSELPVTFTRIGDAPHNLDIRDPSSASWPTEPDGTLGGPQLDGVYSITFDNENQTINGAPVTDALPNAVELWAFRSACAQSGCVATAAQVFKENINQNTGITTVLDFSDGQWRENTPSVQPAIPCRNGPDSDVATLRWSIVTQPDGTLHGVATGTVITDQCGHKGNVYKSPLTPIRTGDVPKSVVIADPALFSG